jgi:hypothetical protein
MRSAELRGVAQALLERARREGYLVRRQVREEVARARLPEAKCAEILSLARPSLRYRNGRYYYVSPSAARLRARARQQQRQTQDVHRAVRALMRSCGQVAVAVDHRQHSRSPFIRPVRILTRDGSELHFLSQDISESGIRLVGSCSLLRQQVRVLIPRWKGPPWCFEVSILWATPVGDGLISQGGIFLQEVPYPQGDRPA